MQLPEILPALYGIGKKKVSFEQVLAYVSTVESLRNKMAAIPLEERRRTIDGEVINGQ